jgi:hydroxymethylglutaryl-CoA reductase
MGISSKLPGFYKLDVASRRAHVTDVVGLTSDENAALTGEMGLTEQHADRMIENVIGTIGVPLGVCANLIIDGRDRLVPMATEEPSVVAAACHAAKLLRAGGGVTSTVSESIMVGQIQILGVPDLDHAENAITAEVLPLLALANSGHPRLSAAGGGAQDIEMRRLMPYGDDDPLGTMLIVHLIVDVRDAMGANAINGMCERIAPTLGRLSGGRVRLRILSNLSDRRTVRVKGVVPFSALEKKDGCSSEDVAQGIVEASVFAERDPYRAATHNKGIMNGIDAVLLAFGQDWRAVEAGAHAFAARQGRYTALSRWRLGDGVLVGELELPMAVGTVGGVVNVHPTVKVAHRIAGVKGAADLARLAGAVGLAQNLGALQSLASEGIQRGHMALHANKAALERQALK